MTGDPFAGTIGALLDERARDSADRPFVTAAGTTLGYGEFADRVRRLAAGFRGLGVRRGDTLGLALPNGVDFLLGMFAAARLGALFVPTHAQFTAREVEYVLVHSDAVAVLADAERLPLVRQARARCPLLRHVIGLGTPPAADVVDGRDLLRQAAVPEVRGPVSPDDAAAILYTSGTTGNPKGVVLTHRGYRLNAEAFSAHVGLRADDVLLCVLPLAHLNAQRSSILPAMVCRAHVVLTERFSASGFWDTVRAHGVTFFSILPTVGSLLLRQPPGPLDRAHGARLCVTPVTPGLLEAFEARFGVPVVTTYGLTEGMLNVMNPIDPARRRTAAVGKPIAPEVHRVRIVDDEDRDVPTGAVGEIVLKSPAVMKGYHKDPEATATALRGGWLHTGDLGALDGDGFVYFAGRKKDIIRRAGENVSPVEVETVLASHPKVLEAAVVGVPDPIREEEIKACVLLHEGESEKTVTPDELFAHCAARLAAWKVPRYLEYRQSFPRTPTLRIQRHQLRDLSGAEGVPLFDRLATDAGARHPGGD